MGRFPVKDTVSAGIVSEHGAGMGVFTELCRMETSITGMRGIPHIT